MARSCGNRADTCRQCGNPPPNGERISARNLCSVCALANMTQLQHEYANETGPFYDKWRKRYIEAALAMMGEAG